MATVTAPVTLVADEEKQRRLDTMKRGAAALLVGAAVVFLIAAYYESAYPWVGYVRATAEAAMVGGIADWFAVTALFRHPLGIPIPHTAIIPSRKDRIGRSLGGFVQNNFLSREVVAKRLGSAQIAASAARWAERPENARRVANHVGTALVASADVLRDDDVRDLIDRALVSRARAIKVAPLLGSGLSLLTAGNRHQELLDRVLGLVARIVSENEEHLRDRIRDESPWWVPERVDDKIHDKLVSGIERTLREVAADAEHPLRARFDEALVDFIERLQTSPETIARAEAIKEEVLAHPAVRRFSASLWDDMKASVRRFAEAPDREEPNAVERGVMALGTTVLADPELVQKVDGWIADLVVYAVEQYRDEVAQLISETVEGWDAEATSKKIELQIGRDLQFIRINGTIVGGLVGLLLHAIGRLM